MFLVKLQLFVLEHMFLIHYCFTLMRSIAEVCKASPEFGYIVSINNFCWGALSSYDQWCSLERG